MKVRHMLALGVVVAAALPATASAHRPPPAADAVLQWNAIAQREIVPAPPGVAQPQPSSLSSMAFVQAAVYNAVVAIHHRYEPYGKGVVARGRASTDAAVATAAHDVLVHYFPAAATRLDADLAGTLGAIPDGKAEDLGVEVGHRAATQLLESREGDGWLADIGFTMPAPAPGVWQLPAGQSPTVPWLSQLRPFTLRRPDQFRPGPAPALSSTRYATDRAELESVGGAGSTTRTAEETLIAQFYTAHVAVQYNSAFRELATQRDLDALQAARLLAMGNVAGADALIACFDAKYHYLRWRPSFAIPGFTPLLATPSHPEYPSAHACLTFAEAEVLSRFLGTRQIEIDLRSFPTNPAMPVRHLETADDLEREIVDARVWGGIHFRTSDEVGGVLGRRVASWALDRNFRRR